MREKAVSGIVVTLLVVGMLSATLRTAEASPYDNWFWVDPSYYEGTRVGETFSVSVKLNCTVGQGGHGMYGYLFKFYWRRDLLNATGYTKYSPEEWGDHWSDIGDGLVWDYNETHGRYYTATSARAARPELYGVFTLVTIHFKVICKPPYAESLNCVLNIVDADLSGVAGYVIDVDVYDGLYEIKNVVIAGDINLDGVVDVFDGVIIGTAWNSKPGDANWDPRADLKEDEAIDLYDITIWGEHFGEKA